MFKKLFSNRDQKKDHKGLLDKIENGSYFDRIDSKKATAVLDIKEEIIDKNNPQEVLKEANHNFEIAQEAYSEKNYTRNNEEHEHCMETASYHYQKTIELYESIINEPNIITEEMLSNLCKACLQIRANIKAAKYSEILVTLQIQNTKQIIKEHITDYYFKNEITTQDKFTEKMKKDLSFHATNSDANHIYELIRSYLSKLYAAKDAEKALEAYSFLCTVNPNDKRNQVDLGNYYYTHQKDYVQAEKVFQDLKTTSETNKHLNKTFIEESYRKLWRIFRKTDQFDKCKILLNEAIDKGYLSLMLEHLNCTLDIDEFENRSIKTLLAEVRESINIFFDENKAINNVIPNYHLNKLREIRIIDGVCPDGITTLGLIHFNPQDNDTDKVIESFEKGLIECEQFQVRLHEIGHNIALNMKYHAEQSYQKEYSFWLILVKEFQLDKDYGSASDPANEAFADFYASYIMFHTLWTRHKSFSEKNRRIFNYFNWLLGIDSHEEANTHVRIQNISAQEFNMENMQSATDIMLAEMEEIRKGKLKH